ncbi:MAG TPA: DUF4870 domain-containing protein [Steroidobacteraceae bacterium]|nr:DUF4870 domain-containing protein [Steroidobacteraceae bacterium]
MHGPDSSEPAAADPGAPTQEERTWGMLAHLAAFSGLLVPVVGNVAGPLVVWLARRHRSRFIAEQGREALNFNISVVLGMIVCGILAYVLVGLLLGLILFVYWLIATIVAGVKAAEGIHYRYPVALRFVK